jgi:hypothetical protein
MSENESAIILSELVQKVKSGECILFLGSAVHCPSPPDSPYNYPSDQSPPLGAALSEKLADKFKYDIAFCGQSCQNHQSVSRVCDHSCKDLQRVSLYVETQGGLGRKSLIDALKTHLRENKKPSPVLRMLASLPFKIIITTNYDLLFESALSKYDKTPKTIVYNPNDREVTEGLSEEPTKEQPILFKMHGDLDHPDSIVITDEDYINFVQRMSDKDDYHPVPAELRIALKKWKTLFVGYSLRDYNLRLLFRTLRWHVDKSGYEMSFAIDRNPDPLILKVWQQERKYITFVSQDIWSFVPWLYKEIHGKEYTE